MTDLAPANAPPPLWQRLGAPLLLVALCAAAFCNALPDEYVFDSKAIVAEHRLLAPGSAWTTLFVKTYWGDLSHGGLYRPFTMLSFFVEKRALGFDSPGPHAAVNAALHAAAVLLLWRLALQWTGGRMAALVAASLYAVHPVATEVVPNLVGRSDLLAAVGVLGALLAWERQADAPCPRGRAGWLVAALLLWALGLLSKESAVVFAPIALFRDAWRFRRAGLSASVLLLIRRRWAPFTAVAAVGVAYLSLYAWVLSSGPPRVTSPLDNPLAWAPADVRVLTAVKVVAVALRICALPIWLSADYSFDQIQRVVSPLDPGYLAGLVLILALAAAVVYAWRVGSPAGLGLAFAAIAYLPTSNLFFTIGTVFADRLLYLPLAGLCLAAGAAFERSLQWTCRTPDPPAARRAALAAIAAVVLLLGSRTLARNPVWRDADTLFLQTVEDAPRSVRVRNVVAKTHAGRPESIESLDAAVRHAGEAFRLVQNLPEWVRPRQAIDAGATLLDRGVFLKNHGQPERGRSEIHEAIRLFQEAIRLRAAPGPREEFRRKARAWRHARGIAEPLEPDGEYIIHANLGKAYFEIGAWPEAAEALTRASEIDPHSDHALAVSVLLARSLANTGDFAAAEAIFTRLDRGHPGNVAVLNDLLRLQLVTGQLDAAEGSLEALRQAGVPEADLAPQRAELEARRNGPAAGE